MFLLEIALVNSWVLHTDTQEKREEKPMSFLSYRRKLGKELIKGLAQHRDILTTPQKVIKTKPSAEHVELWGKCHIGKGTKRKCSLCNQHKTTYTCEECEIPLCIIPCYNLHCYSIPQK